MAKVKGLAVPYLSLSGDLGGYVEKMGLDSIVLAPDVRLLYQHDSRELLARTSSGTLRIEKRGDGVYFDADLPNDFRGSSVLELIERGDLRGCSFKMNVLPDWQELDINSTPAVRTIKKAIIDEISIVCSPAYPETFVEVE